MFKLDGKAHLEAKPSPDSMAMTKIGADFYVVYNLSGDENASIGIINYEQVKKLYTNADAKRRYDEHVVKVSYLTNF